MDPGQDSDSVGATTSYAFPPAPYGGAEGRWRAFRLAMFSRTVCTTV